MSTLPPLPAQFSAEVIRSDGGISRIYADRLKRRIERLRPDRTDITIGRLDKGVAWRVFPATESYGEVRLSADIANADSDQELYNWVEEGTEAIDDRQCRKFSGWSLTSPIGCGSPEAVCYVDYATGMRRRFVTFRSSGVPSVTIDYQNVNLEPPPSELFELPAGYKCIVKV